MTSEAIDTDCFLPDVDGAGFAEQLERLKSRQLDVGSALEAVGSGYPELHDHVFAHSSLSVAFCRDHPFPDKMEIDLEKIRSKSSVALIDRHGRGVSHVIDEIFAA